MADLDPDSLRTRPPRQDITAGRICDGAGPRLDDKPPPLTPSGDSSGVAMPDGKTTTPKEPGDSKKRTGILVTETSCFANSASSNASFPWRPAAAAASTRSSEAREVHHVTFAEPCNRYVHSDSGIVLSPDDSDYYDAGVVKATDYDVTAGDCDVEVTDDEGEDECGGGGFTAIDTSAAVPGRPIIKLHRCVSTESHDNPFLSDGDLRRKADYIIAHSTFLRTCIRVLDPDQIPPEEQIEKDTATSPVPDRKTPESEPRKSVGQLEQVEDHSVAAAARCHGSSVSNQRLASKSEAPVVLQNGETAEEPLLVIRREAGNLTQAENPNSKGSQKKPKGGNCCLVQ